MKEKLVALMEQYKSQGLVKGNELLLPPESTFQLVAELERLNVIITGVYGWYYVKPDNPKWIAEDTTVFLYVGDDIDDTDDPVHESAARIKDYIAHHLHENTAFLSLLLDIPNEWGIVY